MRRELTLLTPKGRNLSLQHEQPIKANRSDLQNSKKAQEFETTGIWKSKKCRLQLKTDGLVGNLIVLAVRSPGPVFQSKCPSILWPKI